jgi:hypothetical protein
VSDEPREVSGTVIAMMLSRRSLLASLAAVSGAAVLPRAVAAQRPTVTVYKSPT